MKLQPYRRCRWSRLSLQRPLSLRRLNPLLALPVLDTTILFETNGTDDGDSHAGKGHPAPTKKVSFYHLDRKKEYRLPPGYIRYEGSTVPQTQETAKEMVKSGRR